jgi:plasmid stabilization system protein ParE
MSGYLLSPRAKADLEEIWDYSEEIWGTDRAERYVRDLWEDIKYLAANPKRVVPAMRCVRDTENTRSVLTSFSIAQRQTGLMWSAFCISGWISSSTSEFQFHNSDSTCSNSWVSLPEIQSG